MPPDSVDLTNCDREPIHIPGSIQPHGCLLACDARATTVLCHSANAGEMLGLVGEINGATLEGLIGDEAAHKLRNAIAGQVRASRRALVHGLPLASGVVFDVAIHVSRGVVVIEFEPAEATDRSLELARMMIDRLAGIADLDRMIDATCRLAHSVLGYDRVMIYRFGQDGAGRVIAETRRRDLESFLGQYFPASDIPRQARALYLANTIRVISDANGARMKLIPEHDPSGQPLDLTHAHLRSVSPIHCEYLRNMGVAASMSISVIIDGQLWGLIACHHYTPRTLSMSRRTVAEIFAEFFSLRLGALEQARGFAAAAQARQQLDRLLHLTSHHDDVEAVFREHLPDIASLMPCDGAGLWINGRWTAQGSVPPEAAIPHLAGYLAGRAESAIWATDSLPRAIPEARAWLDKAAGMLAIPLSQLPRDYLLLFRREVVQTLDWAGNPEKSYAVGPLGDRLTPRKSFAIWKETVHEQCDPWTDADREVAEAARGALVEIALRHSELLADERAKAALRQRLLNEELNHRVKNILAVIQSLVGHPIAEGRSVADYVAALKGRIRALALAHDQVVRGDNGGLLADLLAAELSPHRSAAAGVELAGPPVWLDARAFSVMALMLHELATNAAKYGALSVPGGKLAVEWTLTAEGDCVLVWQESGGPPVAPPRERGFGTVLIDRSVPFDLGGESDMVFARDGLRARFRLPARHVARAGDGTSDVAVPPATAETPGDGTLVDKRVLLVEDQMIIAMDVELILADHGTRNVTTCASVAETLNWLRDFTPDLAILDVNLGTGTSIPIARLLRERGVPFFFATGYGDSIMVPPDLAGVPIVRKPYDERVLIGALESLLASP